MKRNFFNDSMEILKKYINEEHGGNISSASESLGMTGDTLYKWIKEKRTPKLEAIGPILDKLGFCVESLHTIRNISQNAVAQTVSGDDVKTINVYASAGAGAGIAISELEPLFSVTAPPEYFYRCDFAIHVDGHSMEPTIPHHSVVGVREVQEFRANELYVAYIPYEGMVVKRVAVDRERGEFIFKSDNVDKEAYPDFREPIEAAEKIIQGRVVWIMYGY